MKAKIICICIMKWKNIINKIYYNNKKWIHCTIELKFMTQLFKQINCFSKLIISQALQESFATNWITNVNLILKKILSFEPYFFFFLNLFLK